MFRKALIFRGTTKIILPNLVSKTNLKKRNNVNLTEFGKNAKREKQFQIKNAKRITLSLVICSKRQSSNRENEFLQRKKGRINSFFELQKF